MIRGAAWGFVRGLFGSVPGRPDGGSGGSRIPGVGLGATVMLVLAAGLLAGLPPGSGAAPLDAFDQRFGVRELVVEFPVLMRIGLGAGADEVRASAPSDGVLEIEGRTHPVPAGTPIVVRRLEGSPARLRYRICLATFDPDRLAEADRLVESYLAQGVPAELVPWGARLLREEEGAGILHDHRRVFVAVAATEQGDVADELIREWAAKGERPFVHEEPLSTPSARVEVRIGGAVAETGTAPVGFRARGSEVHLAEVEFGVGETWGGRQDRRYRGALAVAADRNGFLSAVNAVDLESYLKGVVPAEILPSSPDAALRAQAIAARGESLAKFELRHQADPYNLCSEVHCQVYGGIGRETPRTSKAVDDTVKLVMRRQDHLVDAVYGACCGGHSEHNDMVWSSPPDPALRGRPDGSGIVSPVTDANVAAFLADTGKGFCKTDGDKFRWTVTMTQDTLRKHLEVAGIRVGRIRRLEAAGRGVSGRLRVLKVVGETGEALIPKELAIRKALGGLKSGLVLFEHSMDGQGFVARLTVKGGGWGHGVGLCQTGARNRAFAGQSHGEILRAYYSGIEIVAADHADGSE